MDQIPRLQISHSQPSLNSIKINIRRLGRRDQKFVYTPKFPKPQQESWFVVASDHLSQKLLSLQRLNFSGAEGKVVLDIPENYAGESLIIRVLSDGWRGIDYEISVQWNSASAEEEVK